MARVIRFRRRRLIGDDAAAAWWRAAFRFHFWPQWVVGRKVNKLAAEEAWMEMLPTNEDPGVVLARILALLDHRKKWDWRDRIARRDVGRIPHPETFLRSESFAEDDVREVMDEAAARLTDDELRVRRECDVPRDDDDHKARTVGTFDPTELRRGRRQKKIERLFNDLRERHPDWDRERTRREAERLADAE